MNVETPIRTLSSKLHLENHQFWLIKLAYYQTISVFLLVVRKILEIWMKRRI